MPNLNVVTPHELETLLAAYIADGDPLLIAGAPGIGKTDIVFRAAAAANADLVLWHPAVADPTDFKGLPWFDAKTGTASFRPFANLLKLIEAKRRLVCFLDDLGHAPPAVQAAVMQLILAGEIDGVRISPHVTFVAATNRHGDKAGVNVFLEPVKSRFVSIVELVPTVDAWCEWALANGISSEMIAYIRYRGLDALSKFVPSNNLINSPSPRTWAHAARTERKGLPAGIEKAAMAGAIGDTESTNYLAFRHMYRNLVNVDAILLNPQTAPLPNGISERWAVSTALAGRANTKNLKAVGIYAQRLVDAGHGEFGVLIIRDATRRDSTLQQTDAFIRIAAGPLGQLFSGTAAA